MSGTTIHRRPDLPVMDVGAPEPALHEEGDTAWAAYRCFNPDLTEWRWNWCSTMVSVRDCAAGWRRKKPWSSGE